LLNTAFKKLEKGQQLLWNCPVIKIIMICVCLYSTKTSYKIWTSSVERLKILVAYTKHWDGQGQPTIPTTLRVGIKLPHILIQ